MNKSIMLSMSLYRSKINTHTHTYTTFGFWWQVEPVCDVIHSGKVKLPGENWNAHCIIHHKMLKTDKRLMFIESLWGQTKRSDVKKTVYT